MRGSNDIPGSSSRWNQDEQASDSYRRQGETRVVKGLQGHSQAVRTETGGFVIVHAIDANSPPFANDFLYVFKQNVRKARKENRERFGSADRVAEGA